ncbi:hypothetical protein ACW73L_07375 [Methylolobus aquaticus]
MSSPISAALARTRRHWEYHAARLALRTLVAWFLFWTLAPLIAGLLGAR